MPRGSRGEYKTIAMIVDTVVIGLISARQDVIDRFNIPDAVVNLEVPGVTRKGKDYDRNLYDNMNTGGSSGTVNVKGVTRVYTPEKNRINSGKKIKLDTGLRSVNATPTTTTGATTPVANAGIPRLATVNFPNKASNYQIARWITENIPEARRPSYFITPAGRRKSVKVAQSLNQTAGENTST